jgi:hypothetical protein
LVPIGKFDYLSLKKFVRQRAMVVLLTIIIVSSTVAVVAVVGSNETRGEPGGLTPPALRPNAPDQDPSFAVDTRQAPATMGDVMPAETPVVTGSAQPTATPSSPYG